MTAAPPQDSTRLRLYFAGKGLKDQDTFSKSDPYLQLSAQLAGRKTPVGRTETLRNDLNPRWERFIEVQYVFETKQEFTLDIYDDDSKGPAGDDYVGGCTFQLAHVVGSRGASLTTNLSGQGQIVITAVEVSTSNNDFVEIQFAGRALKKMDWIGSSDPYFKLFRILPGGLKNLIFTSNVIDNCLTPVWAQCPRFLVRDLAGPDLSAKTLCFELFDKDTITDDTMGCCDISVQQLIDMSASSGYFECTERGKPSEKYGEIFLKSFKYTKVASFLDYLKGGMQLNLMVAIDFTGSNGNPQLPTSLHYMDPLRPNHYVRATMSVGDILMPYDTDQMVPAFGFGARLPDGQVSHCFHLNFQANPYVPGVQGVLDCYGRTLASVGLAGPTNFASVVGTAERLARSSQGVYTVLLILTDGDITDMSQTIDAIVQCDTAPLSIVIVGVGNGCDFAMMNQLDADTQGLRNSSGRAARRDIVQFVPFRNFESQPPGALAAEVLHEIPAQVVQWATMAKYVPPLGLPGSAPPTAAAAAAQKL